MRGDQRHIPAVSFCSSGKNSILTILQVKSQVTIKNIKSGIITQAIKLNSTAKIIIGIFIIQEVKSKAIVKTISSGVLSKRKILYVSMKSSSLSSSMSLQPCYFYFRSSQSHAAVPLQRE